jgi:hypothetical protein
VIGEVRAPGDPENRLTDSNSSTGSTICNIATRPTPDAVAENSSLPMRA